MAAWWVVALTAEAVSPWAAVAAGGLLLAAGLVWGVRRVQGHLRMIVLFGLALAGATPFWLLPPHFYDTLV